MDGAFSAPFVLLAENAEKWYSEKVKMRRLIGKEVELR